MISAAIRNAADAASADEFVAAIEALAQKTDADGESGVVHCQFYVNRNEGSALATIVYRDADRARRRGRACAPSGSCAGCVSPPEYDVRRMGASGSLRPRGGAGGAPIIGGCITTSRRCRTGCGSSRRTCLLLGRFRWLAGSIPVVGTSTGPKPAPATSSSICSSRVPRRCRLRRSRRPSTPWAPETTHSRRRSTRPTGPVSVTPTCRSPSRFWRR